ASQPMKARSSQIWYFEKLPPDPPSDWFGETGELLSPVATRRPPVKPSPSIRSAPKRTRKRARSRSRSTLYCGENRVPAVSKGEPVLIELKFGNAPVLSLPSPK